MTTKPTKKSASAGGVKLKTSGTARAAAGKSASGKSASGKTAADKKLTDKPTKKPLAKSSAKPAKLSHAKAAPARAERPLATRAATAATKAGAKTRSVAKAPKTSPLQQTNSPTQKAKKAPSKASGTTDELSSRDKERRSLALSAAELAIELALDKKAVGPVLIDVSSQASYTDYIGIVSGRSDRQVEAIADHVSVTMKSQGWTLVGREGTSNGRWTLLDFGDMILHIFYHPVRDIYDIEGLWVGAPRVPLKNVPPEAMHFQGDALYAQS